MKSIKRKQSLRRAKSIRRVQGENSSSNNLNNLLTMLDTIKK